MEKYHIQGGHRFKLRHGPKQSIEALVKPKKVALALRGLSFIKPRVLVKEGDEVCLGQDLVEDKKNPQIKLVSPALGKVSAINYGARRVLEAIVVKVDETKEKDFIAKQKAFVNTNSLKKEELIEILLKHGFWPYLKGFPKMDLVPTSAQDERKLKAIHINLLRTEAFFPDPILSIDGNEKEFQAGLDALSKLCPNIKIFAPKNFKKEGALANLSLISCPDLYPADNLGVQAYYLSMLAKDEYVMGLDFDLVLDIGHLLTHGYKRTQRIYSISGDAALNPCLYEGRIGLSLGEFLSDKIKKHDDLRIIAGGLFSGEKVRFIDWLAPNENAVQVLPEDMERTPFSFFRLGANKLSLTKTWLSALTRPKEFSLSTSNNGEERSCIQSGYCIKVCPVELLPNLIMKASETKDIEKMEELNIHDCVDCGLCTFVCPSKIEMGQSIKDGKRLIEKEG